MIAFVSIIWSLRLYGQFEVPLCKFSVSVCLFDHNIFTTPIYAVKDKYGKEEEEARHVVAANRQNLSNIMT